MRRVIGAIASLYKDKIRGQLMKHHLNGLDSLPCMTKHTGSFLYCLACTKAIEQSQANEAIPLAVVRLTKAHNRAIARQDREQVLRDCGLVKVRGALGGTYWE